MTTAVTPSSSHASARETHRTAYEWASVCLVALVGLLSAVYPVLRAFYNFQIGYNEGWNVYNAAAVTHHIPLFGSRYGWTTVNYPALSFYIVAWLHRLGFDYLLTGRVLSLVSVAASSILVGLIVWRVSRDRRTSIFAGFFCLAVFCNIATVYVGMDDPQILAQSFFLGGLLVYVSGPPGLGRLTATSFLFIVGGNIKHNLIEFPLAVLVDLWFVSRRKVAEFLAISGALLAASIAAEMWAGGPYFISKILSPRTYSITWGTSDFVRQGFGQLQLPLLVAAVWSVVAIRDRKLRIFAIFFWLTVFVGFWFGGGIGVNLNSYFDLYLSTSLITGLFLHWFWKSGHWKLGVARKWNLAARVGVPLILLLALAPSWFSWSHRAAIDALPLDQAQFQKKVSYLRSRPGPAICESMLLCYEAGKPYLYDPFNSYMLLRFGKLNERPLIEALDQDKIGAVEFRSPLANYLAGDLNYRFTRKFASAVSSHYHLAFKMTDCYIYVPKP